MGHLTFHFCFHFRLSFFNIFLIFFYSLSFLWTRMKVSSTMTTLTSSWTTLTSAPCTPTSPSAQMHQDPAPSTGSARPLLVAWEAHLMMVWITSWRWQKTRWRSGAPAWSCLWTTQWNLRPPLPCHRLPRRHAPTLEGTDCKEVRNVRMQFVFSIFTSSS